ncbi:nicotinate (nicotinamide) nucleotide adenylyltransferase [Youxingia wuxianensis]|uniref:Probable nicotinate-nucleotide adenylyltransferase n=1 Tax=Youxingia wuxianensis TaxID=2763678 RepID=A0A926EJ81_9FIRM|nr:nicotinate (nicotinamide) nucleotide adenylyltransferase [Youxingia wuxianensis]MBC8584373.1 nicotinate (nicotinamide) nucleotide adenylyltransferase [Youxingia wuxianensis]
MKIGIFGGTFNPVHNGHINLARAYLKALSLDKLIVIPDNIPPHKPYTALVSGQDRYEMCRLAFLDIPLCQVSPMELNRSHKSYTVDTLEELHKIYHKDQLYFIMGGDMFLTLHRWYRPQRIFELAVMCAGAREQNQREALLAYAEKIQAMGATYKIVEIEPVVISSTQVRDAVSKGKDISALVPRSVAGYIKDHNLYQKQVDSLDA